MEDRKQGGLLLMASREPSTSPRFADRAGSVDDGKSTLIGRLLYDTKAIFEDQLEAVERTSATGATSTPTSRCSPTACAPSGSRASRSTSPTATSPRPSRKFIIADTPGHIQYTRNMVTGRVHRRPRADPRRRPQGLLEQSRRHAFLVVAAAASRTSWCASTRWTSSTGTRTLRARSTPSSAAFATKLDDPRPHGRARCRRCTATTSSTGRTTCPGTRARRCCTTSSRCTSRPDRNLIDARFPVQYVIRPQQQTDAELHDYRGYAGQVAGGVLKPGDEVVVLPVGHDRPRSRRSTRPTAASTRPSRRCRSRSRLADEVDVEPRRHDRPAEQPAARPARTSTRWSAGCPTTRLRRARGQVRAQAHHPLGARRGEGPPVPARRQHAAPRRGRRRARAQRDRPRQPAHHQPLLLRRVPPQPHHRRRSSSSTRPRTPPSAPA